MHPHRSTAESSRASSSSLSPPQTSNPSRGLKAAQALKRSFRSSRQVQFFRAVWLCVLFYGERAAFHKAAHACGWPTASATESPRSLSASDPKPVHILLVTDPQIIDQYTYPDLPFPTLLYPLVRHFSDNYLKNVWRSLVLNPNKWMSLGAIDISRQGIATGKGKGRQLAPPPDAVLWIGDLTDGGRRERSDAEWRALVKRFRAMFPRPRKAFWTAPPSVFGSIREVIVHRSLATDYLPQFYLSGNHDVGLSGLSSSGSRTDSLASEDSVQRFQDSFGLKVDGGAYVVKEHEPGSLKVGLNGRILVSADPDVGATHEIVLINAQDLVGMERQGGGPFDTSLQSQHRGQLDGKLAQEAEAKFTETFQFVNMLNSSKSALPRILLTHVPLYRPPGTSCHDIERTKLHRVTRESSRPLHQGTDRASTYQNLVGEEVSAWLLDSLNPVAVFSGDDHDHCEYRHPRSADWSPHFTVDGFGSGEIPELTVKSMSMTEGVRKPGFARLTLFPKSSFTGTSNATDTITAAYTPCLLPDQIGIWTQVYIPTFVFSLVGLRLWQTISKRLSATSGYQPLAYNKRDDDDRFHESTSGASSSRRSNATWLQDVMAVVIVALPFWIFCQTHFIF